MLCRSLLQYSQYSFFDESLNTSRVTSFNMIWKSCFHLLPYSEGSKSNIISDKMMKFAGHLIMMVLIKGYWKNFMYTYDG